TNRILVLQPAFNNSVAARLKYMIAKWDAKRINVPIRQMLPLRGNWRVGEPMRFSLPLSASTPTQPPGGRLPTLRYQYFFGVPFKLFWFYYALRRAGRPRSSPRRYAAIVGCCRRGRFGFADAFLDPFGTRSSLAPTTFGGKNSNAFLAPAVGEYADATARRSVAHLTVAYLTLPVFFWCLLRLAARLASLFVRAGGFRLGGQFYFDPNP
ncbi:MAG: hypothetical protein LBQ66_16445, partial [Planctomycetaceae bacterium]|nr:hypothetical protein [Planctomycetaceae bacterium]